MAPPSPPTTFLSQALHGQQRRTCESNARSLQNGAPGVPKWSPGGSKMEPQRPPGPSRTRPSSRKPFEMPLGAALGPLRGETKTHWVPRGGLLARKIDRLQAPRGAPGLPQGLLESLPGSIWELFCQLAVKNRVFSKSIVFLQENHDF